MGLGLELVKTGELNSSELLERLQPPRSSPSAGPSNKGWLHECSTAISRDGSILAIGKHTLLLLFKVGGSWRITQILDDEQQTQQTTPDYVTQLAILPLNKPQNPHCIVAGYLSGYIRLYSPTGVQLVAQKFHHSPVRRLVVCTAGQADVGVMALYDGGVIASLTNFNLPDAAYTGAVPDVSPGSPASTTISYRKWSLFGMELVNDVMFVHPQYGAPAAGRVIAVGRNPVVSFYTVTEEQNSPLSLAVALASTVATKLTSAVVSLAKNWWWGNSSGEVAQSEKDRSKEKEKEMAANEPAVSLSVRWGINDSQRHLTSLLEAPTTSLAVATDGFGRVLLVDTRACAVVRMWKGYRDAQCGWVAGKSLYLVVHAPRRGLLEVWKMRHGPRVSAQSIGAGWRLVPALDNCYIMDKSGLVHQVVIKE